jgi:hypothetical protein
MATPIAPATVVPAEQDASESHLTATDRQQLGNIVRGLQQVLDSPAATRVRERDLLRALLRRGQAILERGEADATT